MSWKFSVIWLMCVICVVGITGSCQDNDVTDAGCPENCDCITITHNGTEEITVDCRGRHLDQIPNIPTKTSTVLLSENSIHTIRWLDFHKCLNLRTIDLSTNLISSIDNMSFQDTLKLERLLLGDNITANFPVGIFDPLCNLVELYVTDNWGAKNYRADFVRNKPHLKQLTLYSPERDTPLPPVFAELISLKTLHIGWLSRLNNDTFSVLQNVSLQELKVTFVHFVIPLTVDAMALSPLTSLTTLDLSYNTIGFGENLYRVFHGLKFTKIQKLILQEINFQGPKDIGYEFFNALSGTDITELYLDGNSLLSLNITCDAIARFLPCLQKLSLSQNSLYSIYGSPINIFNEMTDLLNLDFSIQSQFTGVTYGQAVKEMMPGLEPFPKCVSLWLPPNLITLNMSHVIYYPRKINCITFHTNTPANMSHINISHNTFPTLKLHMIPYSDKTTDQVIRIEKIDLSSCSMTRIAPLVRNASVYVQSMDLSSNDFANTLASDYAASFSSHLESIHLRELNLSDNTIKRLPKGIFNNSSSLRKIDLSGNALRYWKVSLAPLGNLSDLDLSNNLLSYLEENTTTELANIAKHHNVSINLMGNPLQCQCYTVKFLKWLHQARYGHIKGIHVVNIDSYSCTQTDGTHGGFSNLTDIIEKLTVQCAGKALVTAASIMLVSFVIIVLLSVAIYRNWWDLKYAWLRLTRQRKEDEDRRNERQYQYDAFVAYNSEDLTWVVRALIPRLETGPDALRLCVHHRNWLPGPSIEENISRSVEVSRKTLVILTNNFLSSGWCELEIQLSRLRGLEEGKEVTVVVALEEIPMRKMSTTLSNLRRTNTWLDWYEYENDRELFWELLAGALRGPDVLGNNMNPEDSLGTGPTDEIFLIH